MLLPLLCASVCALHEDSWKLKVCELVTLGSLDPRRLCGGWTLVWSLEAVREPPIPLWVCPGLLLEAVREPPIPLWVVPRIVVERLRIPPRRNSDSGR